jgi:signal-transduction protein with cAMP-binding, CBS, and nucleotidyltransferase domain
MNLELIHMKSPVGSLVARPAVRIERDATLLSASRVMADSNVSAVLVGAEAEAIVTERDLARALANGHTPEDSIESIASFHPVTVSGRTPVTEAAALMLNEEIRHLVVDLGAGVTGVVSLRALMAALLQASNPEIWLESLRISVGLTPSDCWIG